MFSIRDESIPRRLLLSAAASPLYLHLLCVSPSFLPLASGGRRRDLRRRRSALPSPFYPPSLPSLVLVRHLRSLSVKTKGHPRELKRLLALLCPRGGARLSTDPGVRGRRSGPGARLAAGEASPTPCLNFLTLVPPSRWPHAGGPAARARGESAAHTSSACRGQRRARDGEPIAFGARPIEGAPSSFSAPQTPAPTACAPTAAHSAELRARAGLAAAAAGGARGACPSAAARRSRHGPSRAPPRARASSPSPRAARRAPLSARRLAPPVSLAPPPRGDSTRLHPSLLARALAAAAAARRLHLGPHSPPPPASSHAIP